MKVFLIIVLLSATIISYSQDTTQVPTDTIPNPNFGNNSGNEEEAGSKEETNVIGALLSYNFSGNNKGFSNLTPVIDYGWSKNFYTRKVKRGAKDQEVEIETFRWDFSINPYAAGQIDVKDSSSFLPALMLPGVAGIRINSFLRFIVGGGEIVWAPVNFGYKLLSNFADSNTIIAQHNLRTAIGYTLKDLFTVGVQYTIGWHNSTSESEKMFEKVFSSRSSRLNYLMISLQTKLSNEYSKTPTYFFAEWRGVVSKEKYKAFDNLKILTFGVRANMNIELIAPARRGRRN